MCEALSSAVSRLPLSHYPWLWPLGVGALGGLYGAVCGGFFAALFGGIPTLISEPTGAMTVSPVYRFSCNTCVVGVKRLTLTLFNSLKFI